VKKSVIALILLAVLIIIVSPGIVGRLAEESVGDNLNRVARQDGELVVTSEGFDRGWFSSEGQHRVAIGDGQLRAVMSAAGDAADYPVLVINTHLDHGLIPVSSMRREEGSLAPGLGSAVSTLSVEMDGETIELPGTIYSKIGLGGGLDSRYIVEAGTRIVDDGEVTWQPTTVRILSSAGSGDIEFEGDVGALTFGNADQVVAIDGLTFSGERARTDYGFKVGDIDMRIGAMTLTADGIAAGGMQGLSVKASSSVDDGSVRAAGRIEISGQRVPEFGDVSMIADVAFDSVDAVALGAVSRRIDEYEAAGEVDPMRILSGMQPEFKDLFAAGLNLNVEQFDVALPMGTVEAKMAVEIPGADRASFEWTSLLLSTIASLDLRVPDEIVQFATSMSPEAGAMIGLGYLRKEGEVYVMEAEYKKGLLTVNGAPVPIPLGAIR